MKAFFCLSAVCSQTRLAAQITQPSSSVVVRAWVLAGPYTCTQNRFTVHTHCTCVHTCSIRGRQSGPMLATACTRISFCITSLNLSEDSSVRPLLQENKLKRKLKRELERVFQRVILNLKDEGRPPCDRQTYRETDRQTNGDCDSLSS